MFHIKTENRMSASHFSLNDSSCVSVFSPLPLTSDTINTQNSDDIFIRYMQRLTSKTESHSGIQKEKQKLAARDKWFTLFDEFDYAETCAYWKEGDEKFRNAVREVGREWKRGNGGMQMDVATTNLAGRLNGMIEMHLQVLLVKRKTGGVDATPHAVAKLISRFKNVFLAHYSSTEEMKAFYSRFSTFSGAAVTLTRNDLRYIQKISNILKIAIEDVLSFLNRLHPCLLEVFPDLNFKLGSECLRTCISSCILNLIYQPLFELYKIKYLEPNLRFLHQIMALQFVTPKELGVSPCFTLVDADAIKLNLEETDIYAHQRSIDDSAVKTSVVKKKNASFLPGLVDGLIEQSLKVNLESEYNVAFSPNSNFDKSISSNHSGSFLQRDHSSGELISMVLPPGDHLSSQTMPSLNFASGAYVAAVECLKMMQEACTPDKKIELIMKTSDIICSCVDDFYSKLVIRTRRKIKKRELSIAADDLLVLMAYVLIKAQMEHVISEIAFMEDFLPESVKLSSPGYFLSTVQAAIELITGLHPQSFSFYTPIL